MVNILYLLVWSIFPSYNIFNANRPSVFTTLWVHKTNGHCINRVVKRLNDWDFSEICKNVHQSILKKSHQIFVNCYEVTGIFWWIYQIISLIIFNAFIIQSISHLKILKIILNSIKQVVLLQLVLNWSVTFLKINVFSRYPNC